MDERVEEDRDHGGDPGHVDAVLWRAARFAVQVGNTVKGLCPTMAMGVMTLHCHATYAVMNL